MPGATPRDTYLSLDLDYWNKAAFDPWLIDAIFSSGLPLIVTQDHHDMLPHVDAHPGLTRLVNIDYHSDLLSAPEPLHIGNWVNYVAWRDRGGYTWILPRMNDYHLKWGYCHVGENPFTDTPRLTGWKSADKREGYGKDILDTVAAVGICVSPNYLDAGEAASAALRLLLSHLERTGTPLVESQKAENREKFRARVEGLRGMA